jgi:hypothetical protein
LGGTGIGIGQAASGNARYRYLNQRNGSGWEKPAAPGFHGPIDYAKIFGYQRGIKGKAACNAPKHDAH